MDKRQMLNELRRHYNLPRNAEFAEFFGISPQNAYTWMKRGTFDAEIVYEKCPEVSADWILSGEGEMLRPVSQVINGGENNSNIAGNVINEGTKELVMALERQQTMTIKAQEHIDSLIKVIDKLSDK